MLFRSEVKFRNEELDLRATVRIIEVNVVTIRSGKMADEVHGIDDFLVVIVLRFFDEELDNKLRKDSLNFGFEGADNVLSVRWIRELVFTIVIEEEVNERGVLTRFTEAVIRSIFFSNFNKLLMIGEFNISIEIASSENNLGRRGDLLRREFKIIRIFFKKSFRAFEIIHDSILK